MCAPSIFKANIKRFVLNRRIRRKQEKGRYLVFLPSALGHKRRAAVKLSSRSRRKSAGHRTQSAAHPLAGKRRRGAKASGITQKCAVSSTRVSARPRCDSGCFYSPNKSNSFAFRGNLSLSRLSVEVISSRRMKIDHLLSALRLYERRTPADPPPFANPSAPLRWRTASMAYRRAQTAPTASSPRPLLPPLQPPGPESGRSKGFKQDGNIPQAFAKTRCEAAERCVKAPKKTFYYFFHFQSSSVKQTNKKKEYDAAVESWLSST